MHGVCADPADGNEASGDRPTSASETRNRDCKRTILSHPALKSQACSFLRTQRGCRLYACDLAPPSYDTVRHETVQPDGGKDRRERCKDGGEPGEKSFARDGVVDDVG